MLAAIGVLLLLCGVSTFLLAMVRKIFPASDKFIPEDFKRYLTIPVGVYVFLVGLLLLRFF